MKSKKSNQPSEEPKRYMVKGSVCFADGSPAAGMTIRAFDRDLRSEKPLGEFRLIKMDFTKSCIHLINFVILKKAVPILL